MGRGRQSVPGLGAYFSVGAYFSAGRPGIRTSDSDRDVVARVGGAAGPALDVRPEGTMQHCLQL